MTGSSEVVPTRAALQELEADRRVVREGREFLDQKRMLLATEMLRRLDEYARARQRLDDALARAAQALAEATARHGLDGLSSKPVPLAREAEVHIERGSFLGVPVTASTLELPDPVQTSLGSSPSPEARRCRDAFRELLLEQAALAAASSTLERLRREYRQTERRTRALEDVLEPELEQSIGRVRDELDEQDQEDAVRARHGTGSAGSR